MSELRCTCSSSTLLAVVGYDRKRKAAFLDIKSHRKGRVLTHVLLRAGLAEIQCRSCERWTIVRVSSVGIKKLGANDGEPAQE